MASMRLDESGTELERREGRALPAFILHRALFFLRALGRTRAWILASREQSNLLARVLWPRPDRLSDWARVSTYWNGECSSAVGKCRWGFINVTCGDL